MSSVVISENEFDNQDYFKIFLQTVGQKFILNQEEKKFILGKVISWDLANKGVKDVSKLMMKLTNLLINTITKNRESDQFNDPDYQINSRRLNNAIMKSIDGNDGTVADTQASDTVYETMTKINQGQEEYADEEIDLILGTDDKYKLRRLLNPSELNTYTYLYLDRRYKNKVSTDKYFTWNVITQGSNYNPESDVLSPVPLQEISNIRAVPFEFPNTSAVYNGTRRLSVGIQEFAGQSIITNENQLRFHFLFQVNYIDADYKSKAQIKLSDIDLKKTEFDFYTNLSEIKTLTLYFGNPTTLITLDPDVLYATIYDSGSNTTIIDFGTTLHNLSLNDIIIISGWTTTVPSADYPEIQMMNQPEGWHVVFPFIPFTIIPDPFKAEIALDIAGLTGVATGSPYKIYLESKRFVIPLVIRFMKPDIRYDV